MKSTRFTGWAVGVALFYCTLPGVCQSIPGQAETASRETETIQTSIRLITADAKADGRTAKSCQKVLAVMMPYIQAYPHPDGWTWFVACDESAWARIQSRMGFQAGSGILAITNREARATIVRGSAMLHAYGEDYRAQPEHIIAHELSHIYLQSSDEAKVDALATRWVDERRAKHLAVLTP